MTLYVFPDPRSAVSAILKEHRPARWPGATISTTYPTSANADDLGASWPLSDAWIQHAWDGTPTQESNRQRTAIRVTVWTPQHEISDGINLAQLVRAVLLDSGSASVWRFLPGAGPLADVDNDSGLPFCTFTVTAETRPTAVA